MSKPFRRHSAWPVYSLHGEMTKPDTYIAQNSLACALIYFKERTDLTPEERGALDVATAAVEALCMMIARRTNPARLKDRAGIKTEADR